MSPHPTSAPVANPVSGLLVFILADLIGEGLRHGLSLPIPGAVLGIAIMFAVFAANGGVPVVLDGASQGLLRHLPLFFVPAGVGIMGQVPLIGHYWPAIMAALAGSTVLCLLVTAAVLAMLNRLFRSFRANDD
jgi:holin-like protein